MERRIRQFIVVLIILAMAVLAAMAQDNLRVDVRLVNIVATVTDRTGRYAGDLTAETSLLKKTESRNKLRTSRATMTCR